MKRLLLLGVLAAAVLVPAATAAPRPRHAPGTVIAKDRAHHALVVARPGGRVQMLVAPAAFGRTGDRPQGRDPVQRRRGRLPLALTRLARRAAPTGRRAGHDRAPRQAAGGHQRGRQPAQA